MSDREEFERFKRERLENKKVLRRSKRIRDTVGQTGSDTETESESNYNTNWGGQSDNNTTVVEQGESESEESGSCFGNLSNTAYFNHKFEDEAVRKTISFQGAVEKGKKREKMSREGDVRSKTTDSGLGRTPEPGMGDLLRWMADEQKKSREEAERREARIREETKEREDRLWTALGRINETPEPEARAKSSIPLPYMKDKDEITEFLPRFEAAVTWGKVPKAQWRELLASHIPIDLLMRVNCQLDEETSTYDDIVAVLTNSSTLTFSAAAEEFCTGERGRIWEKEGREATMRILSLLGQVTREAEDKRQILENIAVVTVRDKLVPDLKAYVDSSRKFELQEFLGVCDEWEKRQPVKTSWFKKKPSPYVNNRSMGSSGMFAGRKPVSCFACGVPVQTTCGGGSDGSRDHSCPSNNP